MQQQSFHVYAVHFVDQLFTHSLLRALSHLPLMQMLHFFHVDDLGGRRAPNKNPFPIHGSEACPQTNVQITLLNSSTSPFLHTSNTVKHSCTQWWLQF